MNAEVMAMVGKVMEMVRVVNKRKTSILLFLMLIANSNEHLLE